MKILLQYFEGCPNWQLAQHRLTRAANEIGLGGAKIELQLVDSPEVAEQLGFRGSPTILIDGRDPFATEGTPIGFSCRVYQTEKGPAGAPSEAQLRAALTRSS